MGQGPSEGMGQGSRTLNRRSNVNISDLISVSCYGSGTIRRHGSGTVSCCGSGTIRRHVSGTIRRHGSGTIHFILEYQKELHHKIHL